MDSDPTSLQGRSAVYGDWVQQAAHVREAAIAAVLAEAPPTSALLALTRLTAWASLNREELTTDKATEILADLVAEREARPITPETILGTQPAAGDVVLRTRRGGGGKDEGGKDEAVGGGVDAGPRGALSPSRGPPVGTPRHPG